jgi:hypothetical protein
MTQIATVFQIIKKTATSSVLFVVLACFCPFLHLFTKFGQEGILHWKWMASFLNSIGWALAILFLGISMLIDLKDKLPETKTIHRIKALLVLCIGLFYVAYTFIAIRDFSNTIYYTMLAGIAITLTFIIYLANRYYTSVHEKLKIAFSRIYNFANQVAPDNHIPENNKESYFDDFDSLVDDIDL